MVPHRGPCGHSEVQALEAYGLLKQDEHEHKADVDGLKSGWRLLPS